MTVTSSSAVREAEAQRRIDLLGAAQRQLEFDDVRGDTAELDPIVSRMLLALRVPEDRFSALVEALNDQRDCLAGPVDYADRHFVEDVRCPSDWWVERLDREVSDALGFALKDGT